MENPKEEGRRGLVDLFTKQELKKYFLRYVYLIGCVEIFIFLICFFSVLEPYDGPFPWREYFYAAFTIPIAITFILGIIIMAFNTYYFRDDGHLDSLKADPASEKPQTAKAFFNLSWQFQFMVILLILGLCAVFLFQMDDLLAMLGNAGEKASEFILILLGILLGGAILLGSLFLVLQYRLRKRKMEYTYQYRCELMNRTGMMLLEDNTLVDTEGKVVHSPYSDQGRARAIGSDDMSLVPQIEENYRNAENQ
ncbi:MAG: hypothetical protein ACQERN_14740 [Thermodesulfobacteriota bacterium]